MRRKGKYRKEKKILIRVNTIEKELAEELSHAEGKNKSEFCGITYSFQIF